MLQYETDDGRMIYINLDRVISVANRPSGDMMLAHINPEGQVKRQVVKRVPDSGTTFSAPVT